MNEARHNGIVRNVMKRGGNMPVEISGVQYFLAAEVAATARVSRTTFWRWRQQGKIPQGNRLRGRQLLYTEDELQGVLDYANHVEPALQTEGQLRLFNGRR